MIRTLKKIGNSKGFVMTRDMLAHLGVTDAVEVELESGRIVITAPQVEVQTPHRQSFEEAMQSSFAQYENALQRLADVPGNAQGGDS